MPFMDKVNSVVDRTLGFFSPSMELDRVSKRMAVQKLRGYDVGGKGWNNPFARLKKTTGASEASGNFQQAAAAGQELCRNNPLAQRIKTQWAGNVIGSGVPLSLIGGKGKRNKSMKANIEKRWEKWANSTECDFYGQQTLGGMQNLWVASMVESGGVLIRKHTTSNNKKSKVPLQLQTIDHQHLNKQYDTTENEHGGVTRDGIAFDKYGRPLGCWLLINDITTIDNIKAKPQYYKFGEDIHYIYRKERAGQHIGVSWIANVATTIQKYGDTQDAKITQLQIAACLSLIVKEAEQEMGLNKGTSVQSTLGHELAPATINYVKGGTEVETVTPPNPSEASEFMYELKNDIAAGVGLTTAQLTGDYSRFNFASGRMSKIDFYMMLEFIQVNIMTPAFNQIFNWFNEVADFSIPEYFNTSWSYPTRAAVNPMEEFEVLFKKCRSGMISPKKMARLLGEKLEDAIEGWEESKELWGELVFDLDPEKYSPVGNQLDENDAASSNQTSKTSEKSTKKSDNDKKVDDNE